jgi:hypothetical protein
MIAASLLQSVQSNAGAGNTLLLAVGVAVIGGTSLFGGHGRVIDAVLGGPVVAVVINGMSDLIQGANSAGYEWVVTGVVLLLAAGFDAVVRRGAGRLSGPAAEKARGSRTVTTAGTVASAATASRQRDCRCENPPPHPAWPATGQEDDGLVPALGRAWGTGAQGRSRPPRPPTASG